MYAELRWGSESQSEGDNLALIYSPQLYSAQTEFVTSLDSSGGKIGRFQISGESDLSAMARRESDRTGDDVRKSDRAIFVKSRKPHVSNPHQVASERNGYRKVGGRRRLRQNGTDMLYRIADLTSVCGLMLGPVPRRRIAAVRFGQEVEAEIQSDAGRESLPDVFRFHRPDRQSDRHEPCVSASR